MKRRAVVFSPEAAADLDSIYDWIAEAAGPERAIRFIGRIQQHCRGFDLGGQRGHARDDLRKGLRIAGFERRIVIALSVTDERVTILRLFYGGRNWEADFED